MSEPVLEVTSARRAFADHAALQDVSLQLAAGELLVLLGPNGAGKTTLMRAIAGRLRLDGGSVRVAGGDPASEPEVRRVLGIVPQTIALYPHLTAEENLDVFARLMGLKGGAVAEALDLGLARAGLEERRRNLLTELSGGMQRRLNIVAGTLHNPSLLLLDEPTVGVDIAARERIHNLLRRLRDAGMAIMLSTHDFEQATGVADRVAFMRAGRLVGQGTQAELVEQTFGSAKEILITVSEPRHEELMLSLGLKPLPGKLQWSGPLVGGAAELPVVEARLSEEGVHVVEIRVREPGLESVYRQLTAEEGSA
jgi:ABC-2 type transport system ATP-binding protein